MFRSLALQVQTATAQIHQDKCTIHHNNDNNDDENNNSNNDNNNNNNDDEKGSNRFLVEFEFVRLSYQTICTHAGCPMASCIKICLKYRIEWEVQTKWMQIQNWKKK